MNKTNIIYFTTYCNLSCTYCYQHIQGYPHYIPSREELKKSAEDVIKREGLDNQSLFILFGGEPTTRWEDVKFFMDYTYSLKKNVQFNIVSNGIKFLDNDFLRDFLNNIHYKEGRIQLEISYDGQVGNRDRIYPNGKKSTEDVLEVLFKLKEIGTKYRMRYTVHKNNIEMLEYDLDKICRFFNPDRIVLSEYEEDLTDKELKKLENIKKSLINKYYNKEIIVPICMKNDEMCSICGLCEKNIEDFSLYLGKNNTVRKNTIVGNFNDFNEMRGNNE